MRHSLVLSAFAPKTRILKFVFLLALIAILGCRESILHELSEIEANKLLSHLEEMRIPAEKIRASDGSWDLSVKKEQAIEAIRVLRDSRMLHEPAAGERHQPSMIASREEQRFAVERALSREIERTLMSLDGVLDARVHLTLPELDPYLGKPIAAENSGSGSVLLIIDRDLKVSKVEVAEVVAGAAGISRDKISVLLSVSILERTSAERPEQLPDFRPSDLRVPWLYWIGGGLLVVGAGLLFIGFKTRRLGTSGAI